MLRPLVVLHAELGLGIYQPLAKDVNWNATKIDIPSQTYLHGWVHQNEAVVEINNAERKW